MSALKENGIVFFIDRPLSDLIPTNDRPLASSREDIIKRYNERYGTYLSSCDVRIEVKGDPIAVATEIERIFFDENIRN